MNNNFQQNALNPNSNYSYLLEDSWKDFLNWWIGKSKTLPTSNAIKSYEQHPLLFSTTNIVNCVIAVVDIKSMKYIYNSPNFASFLGVYEDEYKRQGVACIFRQIPPDDQQGLAEFSEIINNYFASLPENEKKFFQSFCDYRMQKVTGEYYKVLHRDCVLRHDNRGKIEELFIIANKIENIKSMTTQHLRLTNGTENLFYKFDHRSKQVTQLRELSNREMEIVKLIAKSLSLKQIAYELVISFNTVKNHSSNIMQKLRVKDSIEMVNLLYTWGYL